MLRPDTPLSCIEGNVKVTLLTYFSVELLVILPVRYGLLLSIFCITIFVSIFSPVFASCITSFSPSFDVLDL